ncbi:MAG: hypothetical protein WC538_12245 [Thermoanaerobaculia bacterium]|jgi:hypothetical protein
MKLKNVIIAASIALTAGFASADSLDFVIPAAGTGPGANSSQWQSEVTIHNAGQELLVVKLTYHDATGALRSIDLPVPARTTKTLSDTVKHDFGQTQSTGAIVLDTDDEFRGKLAVTSRTFNLSPTGEFGQDIPALTAGQSLIVGDTGVLNGPANAAANRFNIGVFAAQDTNIEWKLVRRDGTVAKSVTKTHKAGTQTQYNGGIAALFGETAQDNDVVHAAVRSGQVWIYGSVVNNQTGDPTYIPSGKVRENLLPQVLGIDTNRDGVIDFTDANGDGVLDQTLKIAAGRFPNEFRLIANDPEKADISYTISESDGSVRFLDARGMITWWPNASFLGKTGKLVVKVSDGVDAIDFTIPVLYY